MIKDNDLVDIIDLVKGGMFVIKTLLPKVALFYGISLGAVAGIVAAAVVIVRNLQVTLRKRLKQIAWKIGIKRLKKALFRFSALDQSIWI